LLDVQGNEYFQRKSYLTALREYNASVLSAPSADVDVVLPVDSAAEAGQPQPDSGTSETVKSKDDDDAENKSPETVAKDGSGSGTEQKSADDGVKDKASNKNELALAYANRS